jgi:hypothetical protein
MPRGSESGARCMAGHEVGEGSAACGAEKPRRRWLSGAIKAISRGCVPLSVVFCSPRRRHGSSTRQGRASQEVRASPDRSRGSHARRCNRDSTPNVNHCSARIPTRFLRTHEGPEDPLFEVRNDKKIHLILDTVVVHLKQLSGSHGSGQERPNVTSRQVAHLRLEKIGLTHIPYGHLGRECPPLPATLCELPEHASVNNVRRSHLKYDRSVGRIVLADQGEGAEPFPKAMRGSGVRSLFPSYRGCRGARGRQEVE